MGLVRVDDPPVGQLEHLRLGDVEGLGDVVGLVVAELGDLAGHADEPAQHGGVLHDAAVARGVGDGRRGGLQVDQEVRAPDRVEEVVAAELLGHGHGVHRLADGREHPDGLEHVLVRRLVEVAGVQVQLGHRGDGVSREQQGPEQGLLGGQVVRRHASGSPLLALSSLVRHGLQPSFPNPGDR